MAINNRANPERKLSKQKDDLVTVSENIREEALSFAQTFLTGCPECGDCMSRQLITYPLPPRTGPKFPGRLPRDRRPGYDLIGYDCKACQPASPE
jgi:superfamily II helicase